MKLPIMRTSSASDSTNTEW